MDLLTGLLPLMTLAPLLVNNIGKISGLGLTKSFTVFILLYFIFPVVALSLWVSFYLKKRYFYTPAGCTRSDFMPFYRILFYRPDGQRGDWKETGVLFLFGVYLFFAFASLLVYRRDWLWDGLLGFSGLGLVWLAYQAVQANGKFRNVYREILFDPQKRYEDHDGKEDQQLLLGKLQSSRSQYLGIGILLVGFALLIGLSVNKGGGVSSRNSDGLFERVLFADTLVKMTVKLDSFQKKLSLPLLKADNNDCRLCCDTGKKGNYLHLIHGRIAVLDSYYDSLSRDIDRGTLDRTVQTRGMVICLDTTLRVVDTLIDGFYTNCGDSSARAISQVITHIRGLSNYSANLSQVYDRRIREHWAHILSAIRKRGLSVFFLAFFLFLQGWFLSYVMDIQRTYRFSSGKETIRWMGAPNRGMYEVSEKKQNRPYPAVSVFKQAALIVFLLILPFYKPIDPDHVNLDKPFLNWSLWGLFRGENTDSFTDHPTTLIDTGRSIIERTIIRDTVIMIVRDSPSMHSINIDSLVRVLKRGGDPPGRDPKQDDTLLRVIYDSIKKIDSMAIQGTRK